MIRRPRLRPAMDALPIHRMTMSVRSLVIAAGVMMAGCDPVADPGPVGTGPKGVYIVNEGAFLASNAELSYISEDRTMVSGSVYSTANPGKVLGDVAQHAQAAHGKLYVVVNNSRTIEVIEAGTHRWVRTIPLTRAPRAIEVVSVAKAYVTNMDSTVSVIELAGGSVVKDIVVGANPEGLVRSGGRLFVLNGGWGYGTSISVIDLTADTVFSTITTPPGPSYGVLTRSGRLHVLCTGSVGWGGSADVPAAIVTIDAVTGNVVDTLHLSQPAGRIASDAAGDLYVTVVGIGAAGVWKVAGGVSPVVTSTTLVSGTFYGIGVDEARSELYLANAGDFVGNGSVQVHTLSGVPVRTYTTGVGVAPNGFVFLP